MGSRRYISTISPKAISAISPKVVRQPKACPIMRPSGSPKIIAIDVPNDSQPKACCRLPLGATRITKAAVSAQNSACDRAITVRDSSRISKFQAHTDSTCPAMNTANTPISSFLRSIFAVSSMKGSDISVTTHAYTVIISPTCDTGRPKLWPMSESRATGMNSVVLTTKAAQANTSTRR